MALTLQQAAEQQAIAEGYASGPVPTLNPANLNTQANLGNHLVPVTEPTPYYPPATITTPNLGLSLFGLESMLANDLVIIDSVFGGTQLVNGATLSLTPTLTTLAPAPGTILLLGTASSALSILSGGEIEVTDLAGNSLQLGVGVQGINLSNPTESAGFTTTGDAANLWGNPLTLGQSQNSSSITLKTITGLGAGGVYINAQFILTEVGINPVQAAQVGISATTQTTVGAAGGASALPTTPLGYLLINVAGTNAVIPYFKAS
jgi:hypothetical protein